MCQIGGGQLKTTEIHTLVWAHPLIFNITTLAGSPPAFDRGRCGSVRTAESGAGKGKHSADFLLCTICHAWISEVRGYQFFRSGLSI